MPDLDFQIHEIVLAVEDIPAASARLAAALNAEADEIVSVPEPGIEIDMGGIWVGDFRLAIVSPCQQGQGPLARFLAKRGEGISEICLRTSDLKAAMEQMKANGMRFVSEEPRILRDYEWHGEIYSEVHIVFVHPDSAYGMQIELQQWFK